MLIPELKVTDFAASLDFYTRMAGFKILYQRPEELFAMLDLNGARLMIEGLSEKTRSWTAGALKQPFGRGMNLQIEVVDVECLYATFTDGEYPIFLKLEEMHYRVDHASVSQQQFIVQDPDGYLLRFCERID